MSQHKLENKPYCKVKHKVIMTKSGRLKHKKFYDTVRPEIRQQWNNDNKK